MFRTLIGISPLYSGLDNFTFAWDESESLDLTKYLESISDLSNNFDFDIEEVKAKTGLPIIAQKQANTSIQNPPKQEGSKKKAQAVAKIEAFYKALGADSLLDRFLAVDISDYTKTVDRIAKQMHKGTLKPEDLDAELIAKIYKDLKKGTAQGWGNDWLKFGDDIKRDKTVLSMQKNIFRFSGAKTYAQLTQFNDLLHKDGKLRPFNEFKKDVLKVNKRYNKNYLQAEWQTARQAGHHGRNWQAYQKDKDLFPNLEYRTVNDGRVRPEHRALDGTIKPINDAFWDKYYPPNGWRCRCYVIQTTKGTTAENPTDPSVKPEFHVNVGKTGSVFSGKHPYFAVAKIAGKTLQKNFELTKLYAPYNLAYKAKNGATVQASIFADTGDFKENIRVGKVLSDNGVSVKIRPHILLPGHKNPEYEIDGVLGDLKTLKSFNFRNRFRSAVKQQCKILVLDLHKIKEDTSEAKKIVTKMLSRKTSYPTIEKVIIIFKDNTITEVKRKKATE